MDKLLVFINRLKRIGIDIELFGNCPWIYVDKINGKKVKEKHLSEYGFTIMFYPIVNDTNYKFTDLNKIFELIRKYID